MGMNERGFLMAEVLLTAFILSVVGMTVVMCMHSVRMADMSAHRTVAAFLAQKQLACIKGKPALIKLSGEVPWQDAAGQMPILKNGIQYEVVTRVSEREDFWRNVLISVKWRDLGGAREIYLPAMVRADE